MPITLIILALAATGIISFKGSRDAFLSGAGALGERIDSILKPLLKPFALRAGMTLKEVKEARGAELFLRSTIGLSINYLVSLLIGLATISFLPKAGPAFEWIVYLTVAFIFTRAAWVTFLLLTALTVAKETLKLSRASNYLSLTAPLSSNESLVSNARQTISEFVTFTFLALVLGVILRNFLEVPLEGLRFYSFVVVLLAGLQLMPLRQRVKTITRVVLVFLALFPARLAMVDNLDTIADKTGFTGLLNATGLLKSNPEDNYSATTAKERADIARENVVDNVADVSVQVGLEEDEVDAYQAVLAAAMRQVGVNAEVYCSRIGMTDSERYVLIRDLTPDKRVDLEGFISEVSKNERFADCLSKLESDFNLVNTSTLEEVVAAERKSVVNVRSAVECTAEFLANLKREQKQVAIYWCPGGTPDKLLENFVSFIKLEEGEDADGVGLNTRLAYLAAFERFAADKPADKLGFQELWNLANDNNPIVPNTSNNIKIIQGFVKTPNKISDSRYTTFTYSNVSIRNLEKDSNGNVFKITFEANLNGLITLVNCQAPSFCSTTENSVEINAYDVVFTKNKIKFLVPRMSTAGKLNTPAEMCYEFNVESCSEYY